MTTMFIVASPLPLWEGNGGIDNQGGAHRGIGAAVRGVQEMEEDVAVL